MKRASEEFDCPVCGESVPAGAKSCPECGACEKSGWAGGEHDLAEAKEDFDYQRFVEEEFGGGAKPRGVGKMWAIAALVLLAIFLLPLLRGCAG